MSEMIEKVARAIAAEDIHLAAAFSGVGSVNAQHYERKIAFQMARAAIEAMREPTEAMIDKGAVAEGDGNLAVEAQNIWQAMIDGALGEKP